MRCKIAIAGSGVEADAIQALLATRDYADVEALGDGFDAISGADVVVLLGAVEPAAAALTERAPDAVVLVGGSPQSERCAGLLDATLFPRQRVIGVAGAVDARAARHHVARATGAAPADVTGLVVGGDGRVAVVRSTLTVAGIHLAPNHVAELFDTYAFTNTYAPAATALAVRDIADAIVLDRHAVFSVTACCRGELGVERGATCVAARIGRAGIEEILELELTGAERAAL